jgi:hypothetical protein
MKNLQKTISLSYWWDIFFRQSNNGPSGLKTHPQKVGIKWGY